VSFPWIIVAKSLGEVATSDCAPEVNRSSTSIRDPAGVAPARVVMAQERELVSLQTLQTDERQVDERWPVPYAIMLITAISVALWSLVIAAASWLVG
jgi:hypothetical protein